MPRQEQIIHRFWAGPKDFPAEYAGYGEQWATLNPGWVMKMWGEDDLDEFPDMKKVFDDLYRRDGGKKSLELYVQMADVFGYAVVHKYGGVYVNCDMEPVRPLPELPDIAWASYENYIEKDVVNAIIGAPRPRNIFWSRLLQKLPGRYFASPSAEMVKTTGPALLTDMARRLPERIHVFPVEAFNYVHWSKIPRGGDAADFISTLPDDAIAVHHWGHRKDGRTNRIETGTYIESDS